MTFKPSCKGSQCQGSVEPWLAQTYRNNFLCIFFWSLLLNHCCLAESWFSFPWDLSKYTWRNLRCETSCISLKCSIVAWFLCCMHTIHTIKLKIHTLTPWFSCPPHAGGGDAMPDVVNDILKTYVAPWIEHDWNLHSVETPVGRYGNPFNEIQKISGPQGPPQSLLTNHWCVGALIYDPLLVLSFDYVFISPSNHHFGG